MELSNDKTIVNERLHQEIKMLRDGLKISLKNNEESHKLVQELESKLNEARLSHSKQLKELETKIWNYQVKINKYKDLYRKVSSKTNIEDEKSNKTDCSATNSNDFMGVFFENFIKVIEGNQEFNEILESHNKDIKDFKKLIKEQDFYQIIKFTLPFTLSLLKNNDQNKEKIKRKPAHNRVASYFSGTKEKDSEKKNEKREKEIAKNGLKYILAQQNQKLFQINKDLINTMTSFKTVREKTLKKDSAPKSEAHFKSIRK